MEETNLRTVIADDHLIVLEGLESLLKTDAPHVKVVAKAGDWRTCISALQTASPDVLITDLEMPGAQCLEALTEIKTRFPHVKIVVLTMHFENRLVSKLLKLGVEGYIIKSFGLDELVSALKTIQTGGQYIAISERDRFNRIIARMTNFTEKQKDVLALLTLGLQAKEIAHHSGVSLNYVNTILRDAKRKHGLKDKVQLIDFVRAKLPDAIERWESKLHHA